MTTSRTARYSVAPAIGLILQDDNEEDEAINDTDDEPSVPNRYDSDISGDDQFWMLMSRLMSLQIIVVMIKSLKINYWLLLLVRAIVRMVDMPDLFVAVTAGWPLPVSNVSPKCYVRYMTTVYGI